jgi:hypothetical protein
LAGLVLLLVTLRLSRTRVLLIGAGFYSAQNEKVTITFSRIVVRTKLLKMLCMRFLGGKFFALLAAGFLYGF